MKIWFDLSNSPHINLFGAMIRELEGLGHEVVITCRPLANTVDLLELHGLRHTIVGEHYGANFWRKMLGYPIRVGQLRRHLAPLHIDVAISQSSFHSPVVARLLGVPSIYMNDNEHALGNVPAFLSANRVLVPEFLSEAKLRRQLAGRSKITRYPGVKEGIYLWQLQERLDMLANAPRQDPRPSVYVRPEPWTAQYYRGQRNFLDALLLGIQDQVRVTLLPRGKDQGRHYRDPRFAAVHIVETAMDIAEIAPDCDLFVGAGGTMTREMAVLGIPTVSVYQDELLDVDRYLLEQGAFVHRPRLEATELLELVSRARRGVPNRLLLEKGRQAYRLVRDAILQG